MLCSAGELVMESFGVSPDVGVDCDSGVCGADKNDSDGKLVDANERVLSGCPIIW